MRGILCILKLVYKDPEDMDAKSSSSEEETTIHDCSNSGISDDNTGGSPCPSDHPGNGSARHRIVSPWTPRQVRTSAGLDPADASFVIGAGAEFTRKQGRSLNGTKDDSEEHLYHEDYRPGQKLTVSEH